MLLEMHKNTVFPLVIMKMEAFEQTPSLKKDGDGGFCTVAYNFIKRNKVLQTNILIYFKAIFHVIQRKMTGR